MNKKHLKFIDSLGCCCCGNPYSTHHHLLRVEREFLTPKEGDEFLFIAKVKSKGMGTKSDDKFTLPLCGRCHSEVHLNGNEKRYLASRGIFEPERLALFLYENTGNFDVCWERLRDVQGCRI